MSIRQAALAKGEGFLDRILCVIGAVAFSQGPEFIQQYLQRLGGHLDEARRNLEQYQRVAAQSGISLDQLIVRITSNSDAAVAKTGLVMADSVSRADQLATAQHAIQSASILERPFVFLHYVDGDIAAATWRAFRPAVPTTAEGFAYALLGILALLIVYYGLIRYPIKVAWRARVRRRATATI